VVLDEIVEGLREHVLAQRPEPQCSGAS
jgi:hypothetical protein